MDYVSIGHSRQLIGMNPPTHNGLHMRHSLIAPSYCHHGANGCSEMKCDKLRENENVIFIHQFYEIYAANLSASRPLDPSSFTFRFGYNLAIWPIGVHNRPAKSRRFWHNVCSAAIRMSYNDLLNERIKSFTRSSNCAIYSCSDALTDYC